MRRRATGSSCNLWDGSDSVIGGKREDDTRGITDTEHRIHECAKASVEPQKLIVNFFRVGSEAVPDQIRGGNGNSQHIRAWSFAERKLAQSREGEGESHLVHPRRDAHLIGRGTA